MIGARWGFVFFFAVLAGAMGVPGTTSAQVTDESMDVEAHALFEAGRTAFAAGRFVDALGDFQRAYDLSHRSVLLYNIGQCHDRLRHDADALAAFRGYLEAVPDAPQTGEVRARIAILEESIARDTVAATATPRPDDPVRTDTPGATDAHASPDATPTVTTPEPPPPSPPASSDPGPGPWIVLGVGAAAAVTGAILVGVAFADISTVENATVGTSFATVHPAYERAPVLSGIGWAALGVGAAMVTAGIVWAVASGASRESQATLRLGPGSLSIAGVF